MDLNVHYVGSLFCSHDKQHGTVIHISGWTRVTHDGVHDDRQNITSVIIQFMQCNY